MNENQKEALEKVVDYFKNMTKEQYEKEILCLNGIMTEELLSKVIKEVTRVGNLSDEIIDYKQGIEPQITVEEFMDVFHYIEKYTNNFYHENILECHGNFPEYKIFFTYGKTHFVWDLVHGQGSITVIYVDLAEEFMDYPDKEVYLVCDSSIRFFKRIDNN